MSIRSSLVLSLGTLAALSTLSGLSLAADGGAVDSGARPDSGRVDSGQVDSGPVPGADGGTTGDAAAGTDAALPPPTFNVGKACTKTSDCATGLRCVAAGTNDLGPGGPAGGICTVDCSANGQRDCNAIDTASLCVSFDPSGQKAFCLEGCIPGVAIPGLVKCHARPDTACTPTQDLLSAYCAPTCRGDYDCGSRKCDPNTGLCTDTISGTLDTGAACDGTAATNECKGGCISIGSGTASGLADSLCTTRCTLGGPNACGEGPGKTGKPSAACILALDPSEDVGDIGYCQQLCDCQSDCSNPDFVCETLSASAQAKVGRSGACMPKSVSTKPIACGSSDGGGPDAGAVKGTGGAGSTSDGGTGGGAAKPSSSSGCGCYVEGRPEGGRSGALALTALGLVAFVRRRRASR